MKEKNKYIIGIKTIAIILVLILGVLLPNLILYRLPKDTYASSSFSSSIDTKLGKVTMQTQATNFKAGEIVPIEIYLNAENIISFGGYLNYDKSKFETVNVDTDIEKMVGWTIIEGDDVENVGSSIIIFSEKKQISNGKIATIYLTVKEDIVGETNIEINYMDMNNDQYENIEGDDYSLPSITLTVKGKAPDEGEENPPIDPPPIEEPEKEYSITYNTNIAGTVSNMPENAIKKEKKDYIISGIEPNIIGYKFEGWNTLSDGTGTTYLPGYIYDVDKELSLYAQWKEVPKLESLYLSSKAYKIGTTNITKYQEGDKYISRVTKETTLKDFISNLETNGDVVQVIKQDGQVLAEGEFVGTGMKLVITKGTESIELNIAVKGDLSGDGKITVTDLSTLNQTILKTVTLQNEYRVAGDLDENNDITVTDLSTLNKMILKIL